MPLIQVFPPDNKAEAPDGKPTIFDIVAVHGLNPLNNSDHARLTWEATLRDGSKRMWLRDDLPGKLPYARIFLYEYEAAVAYSTDRSTFVDKARDLLERIRIRRLDFKDDPERPLVLLGHSLGGLLNKEALVLARNSSTYEPIFKATSGLAFFATPHEGGKTTLVSLGRIFQSIARSVNLKKGDKILDTVRRDSMFSDMLQETWRHQLKRYHILSFWGSNDGIVVRDSATFGLGEDIEHIVQLKGGHSDICRIGDGPNDMENLDIVLTNITELCDGAVEKGESIQNGKLDNASERVVAPESFDGQSGMVDTDVEMLEQQLADLPRVLG